MVKLDKKVTRKRQQAKIIRERVLQGISTTEIQKELSSKGIGIRRKTLLKEVRAIKGLKESEVKRGKYIPKKYRGQKKIISDRDYTVKEKDISKIYRMSFIIRDLPLHSTTLARNYLGFRLTAFSFSRSYLLENEKFLKDTLIDETNKYCKKYYSLRDIFENFNWNHRIYIENPTEIIYGHAENLNSIWMFRVEKEGKEQYSTSGRF